MLILNTKDIGNFIKSERKRQKLTQTDLAISAEVGIRFLVDLENGKESAQIGKVLSVLNALGINIDFSMK